MNHININNKQQSAEEYPFEGCEKRLFITFKGNGNLQDIQKKEWIEILKHAKCSILNTISNEQCIAHLLSESSLFIYKNKLMIKTCGTTTLLNIIPILIQKYNLQINNIFYSHTNFMYPQYQPQIYQSFDTEINYLNNILNTKGKGISLGNMQPLHCYEYNTNILHKNDRNIIFEIVLFDLDPKCMKYFFEKERCNGFNVNKYIINNCCIPNEVNIDSYLFQPCGYSLNGILNDKYFSIHITPESNGSFVSFETNYNYNKYNNGGYKYVINNILKTFKPKRFGFAINKYGNDYDINGINWKFNGFKLMDNASCKFVGNHEVKWFSYEWNHKSYYIPMDYRRIIIIVMLLCCIISLIL